MKLRILKLTLEQFAGVLQGKAIAFTSKLPSDLEVLNTKVDLFSRQVSIVVRSEAFEDVPETSSIPELPPIATSKIHTAVEVILTEPKPAQPTSKSVIPVPAPKVEAKPEITVSSAIAKSLMPPADRYAAKMENEFSPEQRKLVSFNVKGNCVIVKPVAFLKAEWDDINEVVRSLGGKWVKGDIISYWEIPLG
jgi:hypothetical protein